MRKLFIMQVVLVLFQILFVVGYIRCVYKAVTCNWEPVGKSEIVYTVGACTGLGGVIGWFNIEDK